MKKKKLTETQSSQNLPQSPMFTTNHHKQSASLDNEKKIFHTLHHTQKFIIEIEKKKMKV